MLPRPVPARSPLLALGSWLLAFTGQPATAQEIVTLERYVLPSTRVQSGQGGAFVSRESSTLPTGVPARLEGGGKFVTVGEGANTLRFFKSEVLLRNPSPAASPGVCAGAARGQVQFAGRSGVAEACPASGTGGR